MRREVVFNVLSSELITRVWIIFFFYVVFQKNIHKASQSQHKTSFSNRFPNLSMNFFFHKSLSRDTGFNAQQTHPNLAMSSGGSNSKILNWRSLGRSISGGLGYNPAFVHLSRSFCKENHLSLYIRARLSVVVSS